MSKSKIDQVSDHIFNQLERLMNKNLTNNEVVLECEKSRAVGVLSKNILYSASLSLEAERFKLKEGVSQDDMPSLFLKSEEN